MDQQQTNLKLITDLVSEDGSLDEETKKLYTEAISKLFQGETIENNLSREIITYLDNIFTQAENKAVAAGDTEAIQELAQAREERESVFKQVFSESTQPSKN